MFTLIFQFEQEKTKVFIGIPKNPVNTELSWLLDGTLAILYLEKDPLKQVKKLGFKQVATNSIEFLEFHAPATDKAIVNAFWPRPIWQIAREVNNVWSNVYFGARPYLNAMFSLVSINDKYGYDEATEIIQYFLANATSFRGAEARRIKAELMQIVASHPEK